MGVAVKTGVVRKRAPIYPARRRIRIKDFVLSPDLWMAVYFFGIFQASLLLVAKGATSEDYMWYWTGAGIALGLWTVTHGLMIATKRQVVKIRYDAVSKGRVAGTIILLFAYIYIMSFVMLLFGVSISVQPNQETVNLIMEAQKWPMIFLTVLVAPIAEELTFREFLPYAGGKSIAAFVVFSVLFAVLHAPAGLTGWLLYGGISVALLYLRLKGNNIMQAIVAHIAYNLITTVLGML